MPTFAELIRNYIERAGITDAELARSIGVRRQTIFRWKEGLVARPRHRDDVMSLAKRLRLTDEERDELLIVAGFAPESMPESYPAAVDEEAPPADQETPANQEAPSEHVSTANVPVENTPETSFAVETEDAPVTVRLKDEEAEAEQAERASTARPLWLRVAPIAGAILVLLSGIGYWLSSGESTPAPSPEATSTAAPTREGPPDPTPAADGETLLLTALFENYTGNQGYNVAGRIERELAEQTAAANLTNTRADILNRAILNDADALATLQKFGAALLIWGEYDSGRVVVNLSTPTIEKTDETHLQTPDELAPIINTDVPNETRVLAMLALGEHFVKSNEADKAVTVLEQAFDLNPPEAMVRNLYFQLGRAYNAVSPPQSAEAIDAYTKALELSPDSVNAYYNRGLAYYTLFTTTGDRTDLDLAISDYTRMLQRNPDYVDAYQNRGIAYYRRGNEGDQEAALVDLSVAVEQQPDSYRGFYNRGLVGIALDRPELWEADLLSAKKLTEPASYDYVNTLVGLCWGYMLEKQLDDATTNCQEAIDTAPDRGDSRDSLGIVHALNGDFDAARVQFELYLAWLSDKSEAYYETYNGPLVEDWIEQIDAGEQPITDEVLESLRNG